MVMIAILPMMTSVMFGLVFRMLGSRNVMLAIVMDRPHVVAPRIRSNHAAELASCAFRDFYFVVFLMLLVFVLHLHRAMVHELSSHANSCCRA